MNFDFRKSFANFQDSVSDLSSNLSQNIQPFAARTRQQLQEKLVGAEDTTTLPAEYLDLERQYDEIYAANQSLVKILSVYDTVGYDYPQYFRDTLSATYRGLQDRFSGLRQASSASEAGQILVSGTPQSAAQAAQEPRTLHHALGRALDALATSLTGTNKEQVGPVLSDVGAAETTLGGYQLEQDHEISRATTALRNLLAQTHQGVTNARKHVHNTRLDLDVKKGQLRGAGPGAPNLSELESEVEKAEDEFVAAIEESSTLMKDAVSASTYKPVQTAILLAKAQREYHRAAAEHLDKLLPELEKKEAATRDFTQSENFTQSEA